MFIDKHCNIFGFLFFFVQSISLYKIINVTNMLLSNLQTSINNTITGNGTKSITGSMLNEVLISMTNTAPCLTTVYANQAMSQATDSNIATCDITLNTVLASVNTPTSYFAYFVYYPLSLANDKVTTCLTAVSVTERATKQAVGVSKVITPCFYADPAINNVTGNLYLMSIPTT